MIESVQHNVITRAIRGAYRQELHEELGCKSFFFHLKILLFFFNNIIQKQIQIRNN